VRTNKTSTSKNEQWYSQVKSKPCNVAPALKRSFRRTACIAPAALMSSLPPSRYFSSTALKKECKRKSRGHELSVGLSPSPSLPLSLSLSLSLPLSLSLSPPHCLSSSLCLSLSHPPLFLALSFSSSGDLVNLYANLFWRSVGRNQSIEKKLQREIANLIFNPIFK
jgi:hypothetical protein